MFTKDRSFYREFFSLYWLLVFQNMIILAVNLADNIMLGNYSQSAMSGAATVNQIQFLVQNVIMGLGDAVVVISSQYWGQRRVGPIKQFSAVAVRCTLAFALLMFALVSLSPEGAVGLFTTNAGYIRDGAAYLRIIRFTYPIFAITSVLLATLRSVQTVRIAFFISLSTLVVDIGINYLLIFGKFGLPEMGAAGAAVGTLAARAVELGAAVFYVLRLDEKLRLKVSDYFRIEKPLAIDYAKIAAPIALVSLMWGANTALQTLLLGHLSNDPGSVAIAANSAASNLMMLLKVASVGASAAAAVVIGKTVGSGNLQKVREYARTLQGIFLIIGLFTGLGIFLLRGPVLSMYGELSAETISMANSFLLVMCVTSAGMAYQMPTSTGIIRGGGDAKFCMINDIASIYGVVLPLSFAAVFLFKWPPVVVVMCLNSDQVFKCAVAAIKCNSYTWVKQLTRKEAHGAA